jgi:hypothetical protein
MESWAVKFYQNQNRHKLAPDGITIIHTAKDMIGKLITGYMRKTIFDAWDMHIPKGSHLRVALPGNYSRHGLTREDVRNLSDILEQIAKKDICLMVAMAACQPGVSRSHSIREVFEQMGITDEEYDQGHFRRYFDRYGKDSLGVDFLTFRKEVTRTLKEIYGRVIVDSVIA